MSIDQFLDGLTDFADYFPKFETSFTYYLPILSTKVL